MNLRSFSALRFWWALGAFLATGLMAVAQTTLPNAAVAQAYSFTIVTVPASPSGTLYGASGLPSGLSINSVSGVISGTPSSPGTYSGALSVSAGGDTNNFAYSLFVQAGAGTPAITSPIAATGTVGQSFSYTFSASNTPTSYNVGALPAGLLFSNNISNPAISGTPTAAGTFSISVSANNASGTGATTPLTVTINPAGPVPAITSLAAASAPLNLAFNYAMTASNTPTSYSAIGLPLGLSVNTGTGAITGTPTVAGVYLVALSAANANGSGPATTMTLTVGNLSVVTSSSSVSAVASQTANIQLAASNSPLGFNVTGLPAGFSVNTATGLITGSTTTAGVYTLTVSANNATGTGPALSITLTVTNASGGGAPSLAPVITTAPANQSVSVGGSASFSVAAAGTAPFTYQWLKNGVAIAGATGSSFALSPVQSTDAASYSVVVTNGVGTATSSPATLTVLAIATPVTITSQPSAQSVAVGGSTTLTVAATGSGSLTYQWLRNGTPIAGATNASLILTNLPRGGSANYSVIVTGPSGSVTSSAAALTVLASRLVNLSVRAPTGTGSQALGVGFVIGGSGSEELLVRGVGPTLGEFGVSGVLAATQLSLFDGSSVVIATDTGWGNALVPGPSLVSATVALASTAVFTQVYAFPLPVGSADSAMVPTLPGGVYTVQISGVNNTTGVALAELYDADTGTPSSRLINISARAAVGTNSAALAAGFVISGPAPETVLIRGIGPALAGFGVAGVLAAPQLAVYDSLGNVIVTDAGWSNAPVAGPSAVQAVFQAATTAIFNQVYAFPLTAGSADCAVIVTLPPGVYTAQVSGVGNSMGVGLIEVYETQ